MKAPTSLKKLADLCDPAGPFTDDPMSKETAQEVIQWMQYTYELLTTRKAYHKKQQIKRKMLLKVAEEHLGADELAEINKQAAELADMSVAVETEAEDLGDQGPEDRQDQNE